MTFFEDFVCVLQMILLTKIKNLEKVLGLNSKDRKSTRDKANISNPKVNRGCAPLTANCTSADCVQISLGPSIPYIPLGVYRTGRFNAMIYIYIYIYICRVNILCMCIVHNNISLAAQMICVYDNELMYTVQVQALVVLYAITAYSTVFYKHDGETIKLLYLECVSSTGLLPEYIWSSSVHSGCSKFSIF